VEEELMTEEERNEEALFRHAILGDVLSRNLRRGQLRFELKQLAQQTYQDHHGRPRRVAYKRGPPLRCGCMSLKLLSRARHLWSSPTKIRGTTWLGS